MLPIVTRTSGVVIVIIIVMIFYSTIIATAPLKERTQPEENEVKEKPEFERLEPKFFMEYKLDQEPYYVEDINLDMEILKCLYETCTKYEVDYIEALAIIKTENPTLNLKLKHRNSNGTIDYGLFQINSCNHGWLSRSLDIEDFLDPYQNIKAGVFMLSDLGKKYEGHKKYMAYNMGEGGMENYINKGGATTSYSRKVKSEYEKLREIMETQEGENTHSIAS